MTKDLACKPYFIFICTYITIFSLEYEWHEKCKCNINGKYPQEKNRDFLKFLFSPGNN